jgi:hypothetical protein
VYFVLLFVLLQIIYHFLYDDLTIQVKNHHVLIVLFFKNHKEIDYQMFIIIIMLVHNHLIIIINHVNVNVKDHWQIVKNVLILMYIVVYCVVSFMIILYFIWILI